MIGRGCARRSSCCTASRRPARAGADGRRRWRGRYRALAPDLPGHGQAAQPDGELRRLRGVRPRARAGRTFTLGGYSMGGRIALHAALALGRARRRGWCSSARARGSPTRASARPRARGRRRARRPDRDARTSRRSRASGRAQPLFAGQPERVAAAATRDRLRNTPAGLAAALRGLGTGAMAPLWDRLAELDDPGRRSSSASATRSSARSPSGWRERLPNAQLVVVPGAGHAVQLRGGRTRCAGRLIDQSGSPSSSASA